MSQYYNNQGFWFKARQTVYKWWCIVYRPVYKLVHHGYWPDEKDPYYVPPTQIKSEESVGQTAKPTGEALSSSEEEVSSTTEIFSDKVEESTVASNIDQNVMNRANEIMERLAREAAEDEAKKQAEIDEARRIANENERLAEIMNANKIDITKYIEEGKAQQNI